MTPQQFVQQMKTSNPAPSYLFLGPEMYRRRACRKLLIEKFLPDDQREEGLSRHDLDSASMLDVIDDASSSSLFVAKRVIWASAAEGALPKSAASDAGDSGAAALAAYAKNPAPDVVLVFDCSRYTFESDDKSRVERVRKFFAPVSAVVEFAPYTDVEARKLATDLAQKAGLRVGGAELDSLVETLGGDAARIANEIEKLSLLTGGERAVTAADIAALTPDARATTIFALVNALARGDRSTSLDLLETLVREGEYLAMALTFLGTQFRFALAAREEGLRTTQQIQGFFTKNGVAMWPSRAQQVLQTMNTFSKQKLETALKELYAADRALRDRPPDERIVMERLVINLTR